MEEDIQNFLPTYHVSWDTLYYKHDRRFDASNFHPIFLEIIKVLQKNVHLFAYLHFFHAKYFSSWEHYFFQKVILSMLTKTILWWRIWLFKNPAALLILNLRWAKVIMQGKLFQRCTHFLYTAVYCKHKTDVTAWHGIYFHKNNLWNILVIENYYVKYQNYQN